MNCTSSKRSESSKEKRSCSSHSNITCPPSPPSGPAAIRLTCDTNIMSRKSNLKGKSTCDSVPCQSPGPVLSANDSVTTWLHPHLPTPSLTPALNSIYLIH